MEKIILIRQVVGTPDIGIRRLYRYDPSMPIDLVNGMVLEIHPENPSGWSDQDQTKMLDWIEQNQFELINPDA